jgi:hypothetical protein
MLYPQSSTNLKTDQEERKLILCALSRREPGSARESYGAMDPSARAAPLSRFLMFRVSLESGDQELCKLSFFFFFFYGHCF